MDKRPIPKFKGTVVMGIFIPDTPEAYLKHTQAFEGQEVMTNGVKKFRAYRERSNEQNAYYWHVIIGDPGGEFRKGTGLCGELGYTSEEMHEILKYKFLTEIRELVREKEGVKTKKLIIVPLTTTDLSTIQFEDFLSSIRAWASNELSIFLPAPNEGPFDS